MMLPILISVSEAPVSYFFWAKADPAVAANAMVAATASAVRERVAGISELPWVLLENRVVFSAGLFVRCHLIRFQLRHQQKAPCDVSRKGLIYEQFSPSPPGEGAPSKPA